MADDKARDLLPLVYDELRRLAALRLRRLPPGQTLQPTALVHEAYAELVGRGDPGWNGRAHFFGAAARAMHDLLVDQARRKAAKKRGGGEARAEYEESQIACMVGAAQEDAVAVGVALARLEERHARQAEVARLRVFAGLTEKEIAEIHDRTQRTVERDWRFARAFLLRELSR